MDRSRLRDIAKTWWVSAALLPLCAYFVFFYPTSTVMDNVNLLVHEAGHFFFGFFGHFIRVLGGTLMQLIVPCLLVWHFYVHGYRTGTQVSLFWLGHSFLNIAVYAADARARQLPLLGGNRAGHDWYYMLGRLGILELDQTVGWVFFAFGVIVFVLLLVLPQFVLWSGSEEA